MIRLIKTETIVGNTWARESIIEINLTMIKILAIAVGLMLVTMLTVTIGVMLLPSMFIKELWKLRQELPSAHPPIMWVEYPRASSPPRKGGVS